MDNLARAPVTRRVSRFEALRDDVDAAHFLLEGGAAGGRLCRHLAQHLLYLLHLSDGEMGRERFE